MAVDVAVLPAGRSSPRKFKCRPAGRTHVH